MGDHRHDCKTWKQCEEEIIVEVKPFDTDPNTSDYAIWVHNIPPNEAETEEEGNLYSRIKKIAEKYFLGSGVEIKTYVDHMKSEFGKEVMTIEIKRIKK